MSESYKSQMTKSKINFKLMFNDFVINGLPSTELHPRKKAMNSRSFDRSNTVELVGYWLSVVPWTKILQCDDVRKAQSNWLVCANYVSACSLLAYSGILLQLGLSTKSMLTSLIDEKFIVKWEITMVLNTHCPHKFSLDE